MLLDVETQGEATVVRVREAKLTYPLLAAFFGEIQKLVDAGSRRLLLDMSAVSYVDSASIGCLMDVHRLLREKQGELRLAGLQPRVETMLSMTGVHKIVPVHRDEGEALEAFGPTQGKGRDDA